MILAMARVRILGPRERLPAVLEALQDLGVMHLAAPHENPLLEPVARSSREERWRHHLTGALEDAATAIRLLGAAETGPLAPAAMLPPLVRQLRRIRRQAERLVARIQGLEEE